MTNMNDKRIDELTGATYEKELTMYIRYHGLSHDEATRVMSKTTHTERDEEFSAIVEKKYGK